MVLTTQDQAENAFHRILDEILNFPNVEARTRLQAKLDLVENQVSDMVSKHIKQNESKLERKFLKV